MIGSFLLRYDGSVVYLIDIYIVSVVSGILICINDVLRNINPAILPPQKTGIN